MLRPLKWLYAAGALMFLVLNLLGGRNVPQAVLHALGWPVTHFRDIIGLAVYALMSLRDTVMGLFP